jgi:hypothetical protein
MLKNYKIYWEDLNEDAKNKLKDLYHENINLSPLAMIDIEIDSLDTTDKFLNKELHE